NFLCDKGLAAKSANHYQTESPFLHLEIDSPLISKHHSNWRIKSLQTFNDYPENLHYTVAFSVAKEDLPKVRERLTRAIEECAEIIRPSKEEDLACLCIDLFQI
ncbi:MAG TPA: DUF4423 domain-containing protein, partial [Bdellovibrio sp.]|nr:DUF4423 domain-containing protein [Bdellovibrio sp.]